MRTLFGLVVAACVIALLVVLARAVFRWARPHGTFIAVLAAGGAVLVAYAVLGALAG